MFSSVSIHCLSLDNWPTKQIFERESSVEFDLYLDAKGLNCPMPLLKMKQSLNKMQPGERLKVETTDPGSQKDFRVFCKQAGHQLQESHDSDQTFCFLITKNN